MPSSPTLPRSLQKLFEKPTETLVLDNGLTVVFQQEMSHQVVSIQTWVKSGSIHEGAYLGSGLSHFLEHMLFKGTHKRGPGEIAEEVQAFGGNINAYTAYDRTVYYIDGPAEALGTILELLADQTLNASLPEDEISKEREVIMREIDMTLDDPDRILGRALFSTAYNDHPFKYPVIGLKPLFQKVDRDILLDYYKARYHPANMILSVAGCFERQALMQGLESTFAKVPRNHLAPVAVPGEPEQIARREIRLYGDYQIARGLLAFKIPSLRHADSPGLDIMASIIGSGHSGRLRQRLREELELVHGISASVWNPAQPGLLFIQFHSAPEKAGSAEAAILETCQQIAEEGFSQEELDKARNFALVSEVQSRQTSSGLASRLGLVSALVGDLHYPRRYFEKIHSLSTGDLQRLARETFRMEKLSTATLVAEEHRPVAATRESADSLPPFSEKTLANGARLFWQQDSKLPRTWIRFAGLGGPAHESVDQRGVTSLLATLLNRDTAFKSAFEVARELESEGCFMSDDSGNNTYSLSVQTMPENVGKGIAALRDALLHPAFIENTVNREKEAQIAHLKSLEDDILDYGRQVMRKHFFGDHPFADNPCGRIESTRNLDASALSDFRDKLLVGPNSVIVIAGDFDPASTLPQLEELLLELPRTEFTVPHQPFAEPATTGSIKEAMEREQAVVLEAYPDIGLKPDESLVGDLLSELLSDMSGPLFKAVREDRSLAYYVGASRLLGISHGCFYLYAGTHPSTAEVVYECFDTELDRVRNGQITDDELNAAKTRLKVGKRFSLQSPGKRAAKVALNALFGKPVMDWLDYEERLDRLGTTDITAFAKSVLDRKKRLRLTVGPN